MSAHIDRPHPCSWKECDKAFARKSDLARHMRIHYNDRPFHCEEPGCKKSFIQRSALTVHQRVHTGEKPHSCHQCGRPFADSSSLARHRRVHTGARPYLCQDACCSRSFCRKTTLIKHEWKVHGIPPPPSPSPTNTQFPGSTFVPFVYPSAGTQQDEELPKPSSPEQPAPGPAALSEDDEEVEDEEPEDEEDEEYTPDGPAPKSPKKRTAQGQQPSRKPAVKRTAVKSMSARYSAGTDVVLPPPRPHPGLAPAQPFDPYIPPSQQQQSYMTHIQSAPNTPLGHRPQYSPVEDYQNHPQTATLPPLQAMPGSASQYYPPLPPMHLSPQRPDMAYYHQMPESPEVAYPREAHYILQNGSHPPPSMVRHHSFSGPYYGNPEQRQQDPRVAAARRMSLPQADALPPPQHTPSLGSYAEQDVDFSPSSSMDSTGMPEAAYSLHHHNSASAGPPSTYLSPQAYAAHSQYMPPAALQDAPHEHPYPSQPRMMYMVD